MKITAIDIKLNAPWINSLKQKRSEVKKLVAGLQNKFHISAVEAGLNDNHKIIEIGAVYAAMDDAGADKIKEFIISYLEGNSEADIIDIESDKWHW